MTSLSHTARISELGWPPRECGVALARGVDLTPTHASIAFAFVAAPITATAALSVPNTMFSLPVGVHSAQPGSPVAEKLPHASRLHHHVGQRVCLVMPCASKRSQPGRGIMNRYPDKGKLECVAGFEASIAGLGSEMPSRSGRRACCHHSRRAPARAGAVDCRT